MKQQLAATAAEAARVQKQHTDQLALLQQRLENQAGVCIGVSVAGTRSRCVDPLKCVCVCVSVAFDIVWLLSVDAKLRLGCARVSELASSFAVSSERVLSV